MNDEKLKKTSKNKKNKIKKNSTGPLLSNEVLVVEEPPSSQISSYAYLATSYNMPIKPEIANPYTIEDDDEEENKYEATIYKKVIPIVIGD